MKYIGYSRIPPKTPAHKMTLNVHGQECIVYLETLEKSGSGVFDVYVDFRTQNDLTLFKDVAKGLNADFGQKNTFLLLKGMKTSKRLVQGCYYNLNVDELNKCAGWDDEESLIVWRIYDLSAMSLPEDETGEILQTHETLNPEELLVNHSNVNIMLDELGSDLRLMVRDVDQANWNEILEGKTVKILFDLGAKLQLKKDDVKQIYDARRNDIERDKPMLIISHWDMDHIHCLRYLDVVDMKKAFSRCICVDKMKSVTSRRVYDNIIIALGTANVSCLKPPSRTDGLTMHLWRNINGMSIYQGENSRNINYSGICLFVKGNGRSAALTGDVRLIQAKNVYEQEKQNGVITNKHVLVAPHHGGDNPKAYTSYCFPTTEVFISVGKGNSYNHPGGAMLRYLNSICQNYVGRTDMAGDLVITL